jgi:hypothetical protein
MKIGKRKRLGDLLGGLRDGGVEGSECSGWLMSGEMVA